MITTDILQSFATATVIQGRVIAVNYDTIDVETAAGIVLLKRNASSQSKQLCGIGANGFEYEELSWLALNGHYCLCRIVAYSLPSASLQRRHTLLTLVSFGLQPQHLIGDPTFHSQAALWLANFWLPTYDADEGGIFANILNGGVRVPGPEGEEKWSYITSRTIAGYSFAFQLTGEIKFLHAASSALDFLIRKSTDNVNGYHVFRSRQLRNGLPHPLASPLLNIFVYEYALTGPLRYLAATGDKTTLDFVNQGLESLMLFHDTEGGGFFDALDKNTLRPIKDVTSTKSFTSSADLLAAAVIFAKELNCATSNFDPKAISSELCNIIVRHHLVYGRPFIIESLNADWTPNSSSWRNEYATVDIAGNCGATAKVARVLAVCLPLLSPALRLEVEEWVKEILDNLLAAGVWDALRGGVYDVMLREWRKNEMGEFVYHGDYVWWTQEQFSVAAYLGFLLFDDTRYLEIARSILRFWTFCFMAQEGGVHDTVDHVGNPVSTRMGRWVKNSYHELEFAFFSSILEAIINDLPITLYFGPGHPGPYESALMDTGMVRWKIVEKRTLPNGVISVTFKADKE
jgi:hypothetical protein